MQIIGKNGRIFNAEITKEENFYSVKIINDENEVMGNINFTISKGITFIYHIATEKKFQHRGVGQALMDTCEYISALRRCYEIEGQYCPTNEYAKTFYLKNNFRIEKDCYASFIYKFLNIEETKEKLENKFIEQNEFKLI